jgi:hypothetical protein
MDKMIVKDQVSMNMARKCDPESKCPLKGHFKIEHIRDHKSLATYEFDNGITIEGKNHLLDVTFHNSTACTTWYIGLINLIGYTGLSENDNYVGIDQAANGWDSFQSYTDDNNAASAVTRPEWIENAASAKAITSGTVSIYTITANGTVKGVFVVGEPAGGAAAPQTKGDHAAGGLLWSTALFTAGDVAVLIGDQLKVTYTVSC